jgi:hypothetical protein
MRPTLCLVCLLAFASTASAQSPYVGASFLADVVRLSGNSDSSNGGEAFGGALRVGVPLGGQWGVELELARSGEIETSPDFVIQSGSFSFVDSGVQVPPRTEIFPTPQITSTQQLSTISTMLWWTHQVSDRIGIAYLGGVAFTRTENDFSIDFPGLPFPGFPFPIPVEPDGGPGGSRLFETESIAYDADVAVGVEARIGMTEHLRLTPGVRMQTVPNGWAIRPGIGLQWMF